MMIAAYVAAMRRYVGFSGRATRSSYWWFHLALFAMLLAAFFLDGLTSGDRGFDDATFPIVGIVLLAHLSPALAVGVRRLHDNGRSGWWWLVGLVPLVGPLLLLVWCCQPGTPGGNRFGPDPLATPANAPATGGLPLAVT